jgi:hypothetical protein
VSPSTWLILGAALAASCTTGARPTTVQAPPAPSVVGADRVASVDEAPADGAPELALHRDRHRGESIGVEYGLHPEMSSLRLPEGMTRVSSLNHAEGWRLVVAQEDDDLLLFMTDSDGVVSDDLTVEGAALRYQVLHGCGDDVVPSLVLLSGCSGGATSAVAVRAWYPRAGKLVSADTAVTCFCEVF